MSPTLRSVLMVAIFAGGVALLRFMPFLIFGGKRPVPKLVLYLGRVLPFAMIGMLIIYCYKEAVPYFGLQNMISPPEVHSWYGLPEVIASALVVGLHLWKRNTLLSILVGTVSYMLLVQFVFV